MIGRNLCLDFKQPNNCYGGEGAWGVKYNIPFILIQEEEMIKIYISLIQDTRTNTQNRIGFGEKGKIINILPFIRLKKIFIVVTVAYNLSVCCDFINSRKIIANPVVSRLLLSQIASLKLCTFSP